MRFGIVFCESNNLQKRADRDMILIIEDNLKETGSPLFKASDCFSDGECAIDIAAFVCVVHSSTVVVVKMVNVVVLYHRFRLLSSLFCDRYKKSVTVSI